MDVVGHVVDAVTQIGAVDQDVQRHLRGCPTLELIWLQARRRVGHHDDGHASRDFWLHTRFGERLEHQLGDGLVGLEVPVDAVGVAAAAHDLFADGGLQIDERDVVLAPPMR